MSAPKSWPIRKRVTHARKWIHNANYNDDEIERTLFLGAAHSILDQRHEALAIELWLTNELREHRAAKP